MAYCRWSSDNWKSDVYTYAHCDGTWTTHVAGSRFVGEIPPEPDWDLLKSDRPRWLAEHRKVMEFLEAAEQEPIDLPDAGKTFKDDTPQACAETLRQLRRKGFHVPNGIAEELEAEPPLPG